MGALPNDEKAYSIETRHKVTLTKGFLMSYLHARLYEAVMGRNPSRFRGARRPREVSACGVVLK